MNSSAGLLNVEVRIDRLYFRRLLNEEYIVFLKISDSEGDAFNGYK